MEEMNFLNSHENLITPLGYIMGDTPNDLSLPDGVIETTPSDSVILRYMEQPGARLDDFDHIKLGSNSSSSPNVYHKRLNLHENKGKKNFHLIKKEELGKKSQRRLIWEKHENYENLILVIILHAQMDLQMI